MASTQTPIDALIRDLPPATRDLLAELTALLMSTVPDAKQKVNLGWKSVNFSHPMVGYCCGLFPVDDRVIVTVCR